MGWFWFKFNNLELVLMALKILQECGKKVQTKIQNVLTANSYFQGSYRGNIGEEDLFAAPYPTLNRVKGLRHEKPLIITFIINLVVFLQESNVDNKNNAWDKIGVKRFWLLMLFGLSLGHFWPISPHFTPPENTRKPLVFYCFQGV